MGNDYIHDQISGARDCLRAGNPASAVPMLVSALESLEGTDAPSLSACGELWQCIVLLLRTSEASAGKDLAKGLVKWVRRTPASAGFVSQLGDRAPETLLDVGRTHGGLPPEVVSHLLTWLEDGDTDRAQRMISRWSWRHMKEAAEAHHALEMYAPSLFALFGRALRPPTKTLSLLTKRVLAGAVAIGFTFAVAYIAPMVMPEPEPEVDLGQLDPDHPFAEAELADIEEETIRQINILCGTMDEEFDDPRCTLALELETSFEDGRCQDMARGVLTLQEQTEALKEDEAKRDTVQTALDTLRAAATVCDRQ